jgi:hypothetical protein
MRFGQHLVDSGVVTEVQVLHALDEQDRRRGSTAYVAVERGLMPPRLAFDLANEAREANADFLDHAHGNGHLTMQKLKVIRDRWSAGAPPLGRLLVEMGYLTSEEWLASLNEFIAFGWPPTKRSSAPLALNL